MTAVMQSCSGTYSQCNETRKKRKWTNPEKNSPFSGLADDGIVGPQNQNQRELIGSLLLELIRQFGRGENTLTHQFDSLVCIGRAGLFTMGTKMLNEGAGKIYMRKL